MQSRIRGRTSVTEVVRGVWLRVSSMKVGRTSMSPLRLMMTRWPGLLYRKHSLHLRATASCTYNSSAPHCTERAFLVTQLQGHLWI